jgi:hypothetical protein
MLASLPRRFFKTAVGNGKVHAILQDGLLARVTVLRAGASSFERTRTTVKDAMLHGVEGIHHVLSLAFMTSGSIVDVTCTRAMSLTLI